MTRDAAPQDPATAHPRPDFPAQDQEPPGWTGPMDPPPDHGGADRQHHMAGLLMVCQETGARRGPGKRSVGGRQREPHTVNGGVQAEETDVLMPTPQC
jgi:hypothetical protein